MEDLKKQIESIDDLTDQRKVRKIYDSIQVLNTNDPKALEVLAAWRHKFPV